MKRLYRLISAVLIAVFLSGFAGCDYSKEEANTSAQIGTTDTGAATVTGEYGVRWSLKELTAECKRLEDAAGLKADAVVGDALALNSFDSVYPWSHIKLCNIDAQGKITYLGEKEFAYDGTNGNVFVELPRWYVKRYRDADDEYLYISGTPEEGYEVEPAFIEGDQVLDKIYIGVYDGYITNDGKLVSWSGTYPTTDKKLSEYRLAARKNGNIGYGCIDLRSVIALQHLYLVEHADKNSSGKIGIGVQRLQYPYGKTYAVVSENKSNRIILANAQAAKFKVGQPCGISEKDANLMEHRTITAIERYDASSQAILFTGEAYDVKKGTTYIYNTPLINGLCDGMPSHTGMAYGILNGDGYTSIRYRYIENPWGNVWDCVDGALSVDRVPYIGFDMKKYGSTNLADYRRLNYKMPEQGQNKYDETYTKETIKNLGYDENYPALGLPVEIADGADANNSFGDSFFCIDGIREFRWKGAWDNGMNKADKAGIFNLRAIYEINSSFWYIGGRLIYKPVSEN